MHRDVCDTGKLTALLYLLHLDYPPTGAAAELEQPNRPGGSGPAGQGPAGAGAQRERRRRRDGQGGSHHRNLVGRA